VDAILEAINSSAVPQAQIEKSPWVYRPNPS
jgi:hypothetical protein